MMVCHWAWEWEQAMYNILSNVSNLVSVWLKIHCSFYPLSSLSKHNGMSLWGKPLTCISCMRRRPSVFGFTLCPFFQLFARLAVSSCHFSETFTRYIILSVRWPVTSIYGFLSTYILEEWVWHTTPTSNVHSFIHVTILKLAKELLSSTSISKLNFLLSERRW